MTSVNILHIVDSFAKGGAEVLLLNSIKELNAKYPKYNSKVVTLYRYGPLLEDFNKVTTVTCLNYSGIQDLFDVVKRFRKLIDDWNIDIVHSHLIDSTLVSRLAKPAGVKLVSTYHSALYNSWTVNYSRGRHIIDKLTAGRTDFAIFVSEAVQEHITKKVGIRVPNQVLVNFASPDFKPEYKLNSDKELKIVAVGNLKEVKNHLMAVKTLSELTEYPISLDIYGEGKLKDSLQALIDETKANVTLMGAKQISSQLLSQYDVFLMTSQYEGMPISLLEAMSTGLPSILTDLPMLHETAENAAVYFNYDSIPELKEIILGFFHDKKSLERLSSNALQRASHFSIDLYLNSLTEIYKNLK